MSGSLLTASFNLESEFAKTALNIQSKTATYNIFTKSVSIAEVQGFKAASELAGRVAVRFGVASAIFTGVESALDGDFTFGDGVKVGIGLLSTFGGPIGVLYTAIDVGVAVFSKDHKGVTDRIGDYIDGKN